MKNLTDTEIKFLCKKYKIDIDACLQDINKIQDIVDSTQCNSYNGIKILKSAEELLIGKGLVQCVK